MIPASGTATLHPVHYKWRGKRDAQFGSLRRIRGRFGLQRLTHAHQCNRSHQPSRQPLPSIPAALQAFATTRSPETTARPPRPRAGGSSSAIQLQPSPRSGNNQSGSAGTALSLPLAVTLNPGQSGASATGAGILFTTSAGTLSNGTTSGSSVIAQTNSSGVASVTLTLPATKGAVTVTAQDQFALGGASVTFTETAN